MIEIVSPGNKSSRSAIQKFLEKTHEFMRAGVHILLVDPFPPGPRDPHSLHKLIWDDYTDVPFDLPAGIALYQPVYVSGVSTSDLTPSQARTITDQSLRARADADDLVRQLETGKLGSR